MDFKNIKSSSGNIVRAGRDPQTGLVEVHFRGKKLDDPTIPYKSSKPFTADEWARFSATFNNEGNSTGSYFHANFRNTKDFKKL